MKTIETEDFVRVVFDIETQDALLQATYDWVDEDDLFELYQKFPRIHQTSADAIIEAPDEVVDVEDYVSMIAGYVQKRRELPEDKIKGHTRLTYRHERLEDGTEAFGLIDNFGKAAYPSQRRMAIVPSIGLVLSHTDGNGKLKVQNRPTGERAWVDYDKRPKIESIRGNLGGLVLHSPWVSNARDRAQEAAEVVLGLGKASRDIIEARDTESASTSS